MIAGVDYDESLLDGDKRESEMVSGIGLHCRFGADGGGCCWRSGGHNAEEVGP
jgi:hypothetical protein